MDAHPAVSRMESHRDALDEEHSGIVPIQQLARRRAVVSSGLGESGKAEIVWKVPCRILFAAEPAALGRRSFWSAEFLSCPCIWGLAVQAGSPPRHTPAIFRNVLSPESSGTRTDAPSRPGESRGLDPENCRARLQHRRRSLLNPLDHSFGATGPEGSRVRSGHFRGNIELRQKGRLRCQHLRVGRLLDF